MSHNAHEQLATPRASGQRSGAARMAPKRWAVGATLLTLGLGPAAQAAEGDLDPSFGSQGLVRTESGELKAMAIQGDGKIVAAGLTALARYRPDGSLDAEFGSNGIVSIGTALDRARALVLQQDGKIVVVASTNPTGLNRDFALARFLSNGALDPTFGGGAGFVTTGFVSFGPFDGDDNANALALALDGKIVVVGSSGSFDGDDDQCDPFTDSCVFAVARYNADGSPDTTFDVDGKLTTEFVGNGLDVSEAIGVAVQLDGRIVVGGSSGVSGSGSFDFALARYTATGQLDGTFGIGGKVTTGFGDGDSDTGAALVIQPDGKLVMAGASGQDCVPRFGGLCVFALARYLETGDLDQTFGSNGRTTTDLAGGRAGVARALVLQPGGKLVAAGGGA